MAIDQRRKFSLHVLSRRCKNIKVELSAKTTYHACAVDVVRGKPDVGNFSACHSRGVARGVLGVLGPPIESH